MRLLRALVVLLPIWLLLTAETPTPSPSPPPSSPSPVPVPANAFLSLDPTAGDTNTVINVSGGQFLPNEPMTLYWDQATHVAGSATADGNGSFNTRVKPFGGDAAGVHHLCASVQPNPCANFTLQGPLAASPSPTPVESPSPSPSPTPIAVVTPAAPPPASTLNGFDVISRPPFVFLPIAGAAAIALAFAFWLFSVVRRPRQPAVLPTAAVVHRAMRPDYSAGFGAPPSAPAVRTEPSAWDEPVARPQVPPTPPPPEHALSSVEWGPPVEWGTGSGDWGYPEPPRVDEAEDPPRD